MSNTYFKLMENAKPNPLLEEAIIFCNGPRALDLGAGPLNDARFLSEKGFSVIAVDKSDNIIELAKATKNIVPVVCLFNEYDFPTHYFDLINSQWSLPFNDPLSFRRVFKSMKASLKSDGILCITLYGTRDDWAQMKQASMTFLTRKDVNDLLSGMEIIKFQEKEEDIQRLDKKEMKHWHVFYILARMLKA